MSSEKGLFNVEYVVALIVFLGIVTFIAFQISGIIPAFHQKSLKDRLQLRTYEITEILIKDKGWWSDGSNDGTDWENHEEYVKRFGLANSPYNISSDKLDKFNKSCTENYAKVKIIFGLDYRQDFRFSCNCDSKDFECGEKHVPLGATKTSTSRTVVLDNVNKEICNLKLEVWQ